MIAKNLEDLQVYLQACDAADAISAILERRNLRADVDLHGQLATCSSRVHALISEGFGQSTDRHCAHFQSLARGSCNEMCAHLSTALGRKYITATEHDELAARYIVIGKRLTRWIQHLRRENRRSR
jgi:four helix bundle protein